MANKDNLTMPEKLELANSQDIEIVENITNIQTIQSQTMPEFKSSNAFLPNYLSALAIIFALLGVLYGGLWIMRKFGYGSAISNSSSFSKNNLRVEAQLPLGGKRQIYLVRYMNKRLLLGATDSSISLLSEEYMLDDEGKIMKNFEETMQNIANPNLCDNTEVDDNILKKIIKTLKA